jgi:AAA domain
MNYTGDRIKQFESAKIFFDTKLYDRNTFRGIIADLNKRERLARKNTKKTAKKRKAREEKEAYETSQRVAREVREAEEKKTSKKRQSETLPLNLDTSRVKRTRPTVAFVSKGKQYTVTSSVLYDVDLVSRHGQTNSKTFDSVLSQNSFVPDKSMTKAELEQWMITNVLLVKYSPNSEPYNIRTISIFATPTEQASMKKIKMKSLRLMYKSIDNNPETRPGSCVVDYILNEFHKPDTRLNSVTRTMIPELHTSEEIIDWVRDLDGVSVYCLDPLFRVYDKYVCEGRTKCCLMFVNNNNHLYPITDPTQRKQIVAKNQLQLQSIKQVDMDNVQFFSTHTYTSLKDSKSGQERSDNYEQLVTECYNAVVSAKGDIVLPVESLESIATSLVLGTKTMIESFNYNDGRMTAFLNPVNQCAVIAGRDFMERRALCDEYFAKYKLIDYKFTNQPWGTIARIICDNQYNSIPSSQYSPDVKDIFVNYPARPYRACFEREVQPGDVSIDIRRDYTNILITNEEPYPVFGAFDYAQPFNGGDCFTLRPGLYYVNKSFYMGNGTIFVSRNWFLPGFVRYALQRGYITASDIKYVVYADRCIPGNSFKKLTEEVSEKYPEQSKSLINMFIGSMGSLYHKESKGAVTDDIHTAVACVAGNPDAVIHHLGNLCIIQDEKKFVKSGGDVPIYRQVIESALVKLDMMVQDLQPEKILGFNTDSIKVRGDYNTAIVKDKKDCKFGEYHVESRVVLNGKSLEEVVAEELPECEVTLPVVNYVTEAEKDDDVLLDKGGLVLGMPGCGKTELILQLWNKLSEEEKKATLVVGYTVASAENLCDRGVPAQTFSSALWAGDTLSAQLLKGYKRVILDEFTMLPPTEMGLLLEAKHQFNLSVLCVGDPDQCKAPVSNWIDYSKNPTFLEMCNNYVVTVEYKEQYARYSKDLYEPLVKLKSTGELEWACDEVESYVNVCYYNDTRKRINQYHLQRWVKEHNAKLVKFYFDVCVGLPVMAYHDNIKEKGIFKTQVWIVKDIQRHLIVLERNSNVIELSRKEFKVFDYSFCVTTHKFQGKTIHDHYNIYDAKQMTKDLLYTAMSRGVSKDKVHIVDANEVYIDSNRPECVFEDPKKVELKTGRIYKMTFDDGTKYIGKTIQTLEERLEEHKASPPNAEVRKRINENTTIELVEEFLYGKDKMFALVEANHIKNSKDKLLNKQHNKKKEVTVKEGKQTKKPKLEVKEDSSKKRYEVRIQRAGIDKDEQVKRFPWGDDKASAYKEASDWRSYILDKYY